MQMFIFGVFILSLSMAASVGQSADELTTCIEQALNDESGYEVDEFEAREFCQGGVQ